MSQDSDGFHDAGCYYGGPRGAGFWFAVDDCPLDHTGDLEPLVAPVENVRASWEHLQLAGLTRTSENG